MALIEGVGDEVTLLFGVVFVVLILVLAWVSTHTVDQAEHLFPPGPAAPSTRPDPADESDSPELPCPPDSPPPAGEEGKAEDSPGGRGGEEGDGSLLEEGGPGRDGLRHRGGSEGVDTAAAPPPCPLDSATPLSAEAAQRTMVLRLKFLNDTEKTALVRPDDTIGYIKRTHFSGQEHQVRLIYQGQLLQDDSQTLASLHLADNCVLHCHVSQHATRAVPAGARAADQVHVALNVGSLMLPLFVLMLAVLWYFQIQYRQFFTAHATASLIGITLFFSFVAFGVYRR